MNQYRVSDAARSDLDEIWFYIAQDNADAADRFLRAIVSRFPHAGIHAGNGTASVKNCQPGCEVFPSVTTSSFIVRWKTVLKSRACCTALGISRRFLNEPTMKTDPIPCCGTYSQDARARVKAFEIALKMAVRMNRFAAMDMGVSMINPVASDDPVGAAVASTIALNPEDILKAIEPVTLKNAELRAGVQSIKGNENATTHA